MFFDFFRALFVRYMNGCWCMDLEKQWPQYADFKIAENSEVEGFEPFHWNLFVFFSL